MGRVAVAEAAAGRERVGNASTAYTHGVTHQQRAPATLQLLEAGEAIIVTPEHAPSARGSRQIRGHHHHSRLEAQLSTLRVSVHEYMSHSH